MEANHKPEMPEQLLRCVPSQDGEYQGSENVLRRDDFLGEMDLKDAYLTVPIHRQHRNFLKFTWKRKNYRFKSLPFGLATAPRVFTKILRPLAAKVRSMEIRVFFYLEDFLVLAENTDLLRIHMETLASMIQDLVFYLNWKKSEWELTQKLEF